MRRIYQGTPRRRKANKGPNSELSAPSRRFGDPRASGKDPCRFFQVTNRSQGIALEAEAGRPSFCDLHRARIAAKLDAGLSAQRIHQDLVAESKCPHF